jgi:hypothetical protein
LVSDFQFSAAPYYPVRMRSACAFVLRWLLIYLRFPSFVSKSKRSNVRLVAAADFEEDEVVFCIPRAAVLNVNNVFAGQDSGASKEALLQMPSWLVCILHRITVGFTDNFLRHSQPL